MTSCPPNPHLCRSRRRRHHSPAIHHCRRRDHASSSSVVTQPPFFTCIDGEVEAPQSCMEIDKAQAARKLSRSRIESRWRNVFFCSTPMMFFTCCFWPVGCLSSAFFVQHHTLLPWLPCNPLIELMPYLTSGHGSTLLGAFAHTKLQNYFCLSTTIFWE
jgi:hypothetical protein